MSVLANAHLYVEHYEWVIVAFQQSPAPGHPGCVVWRMRIDSFIIVWLIDPNLHRPRSKPKNPPLRL